MVLLDFFLVAAIGIEPPICPAGFTLPEGLARDSWRPAAASGIGTRV